MGKSVELQQSWSTKRRYQASAISKNLKPDTWRADKLTAHKREDNDGDRRCPRA
jgi:hypothetical protein